jgi:SAM-dependent methyltransferase
VTRTTVTFSERASPSTVTYMLRAAAGLLLGPACALLAWWRGTPGMTAYAASVRTGLSLLVSTNRRFPRSATIGLLAWPLDSTRYVEFEAFLGGLEGVGQGGAYLDVSSPRLLPLLVLQRHRAMRAIILNPDANDLPLTRVLLEDVGLAHRCTFVEAVLSADTAPPASLDLITCMSVLEHIPDDRAVVDAMWRALRPGGRLILTVPCCAAAEEQYTNLNQYGVLQTGADGLVFRQRLYSESCLASRVFAVTGPPASMVVWGEREPGFILRDTLSKWSSLSYPFWSEPLRAGTRITRYAGIGALPGEGVAGLVFVKPS